MTLLPDGIFFSFLSSEYSHGPRCKHFRLPIQYGQWDAGGSGGSLQQVVGLVLAYCTLRILSFVSLVVCSLLLFLSVEERRPCVCG